MCFLGSTFTDHTIPGNIPLDVRDASNRLAGFGNNLNGAGFRIGFTWTRTVNVVGANDCSGETAMVSRSPTSTRAATAGISQHTHISTLIMLSS